MAGLPLYLFSMLGGLSYHCQHRRRFRSSGQQVLLQCKLHLFLKTCVSNPLGLCGLSHGMPQFFKYQAQPTHQPKKKEIEKEKEKRQSWTAIVTLHEFFSRLLFLYSKICQTLPPAFSFAARGKALISCPQGWLPADFQLHTPPACP